VIVVAGTRVWRDPRRRIWSSCGARAPGPVVCSFPRPYVEVNILHVCSRPSEIEAVQLL